MPAQYEVPAAWGQSPYFDLDLPSGGKIQCKRVGLEDLVKADLIDEFDTLSGVAEEKVVGPAKGKRPADRPKKKLTKAEQAAANAKKARDALSSDNLASISALMGRLLPVVILQPKVETTYLKDESGRWVVIPQEDREEGSIYVDTIPFTDQMAILQASMEGMDVGDLESFREQPDQAVVNVELKPEPPLPSE